VESHPQFWAGLFLLGSTYLGIRIGVEQIPPALMCGVRFLTAGVLLLAFCAARGREVRYRPVQLLHMAIVGTLLLMGGNLTLAYAEQVVPSGLSALLIAMTPLWFLVLDNLLLGSHRISRRGSIGLGLGVAGMVVLLWPDLRSTAAWDIVNSGQLLLCHWPRSVGLWARCYRNAGNQELTGWRQRHGR